MEQRQVIGIGSTATIAVSGGGLWAGVVNGIPWAAWLGLAGVGLGAVCIVSLFLTAPRKPKERKAKLIPAHELPVTEGVAYLHFGEWGRSVHGDGGGVMQEMNEALNRIHQAAADGRITIRGRQNNYGVWVDIDRAFWANDGQVDMTTLYFDGVRTRTEPDRQPIWYDLRVIPAQIAGM